MWRDGYRYSKAGVITVDLVPLAASQRAMPGLGQFDRERGAVVPDADGLAPRRDWSTKFEMRSPRYTTRFEEVPIIKAAEEACRRTEQDGGNRTRRLA